MKKNRLIVIVLLLVVGLPILGVVGYRVWRGPVADTGNPRLDAEKAPIFKGKSDPPGEGKPKETPVAGNGATGREGENPTRAGNGNPQPGEHQPPEEPIDDWQRYGWPDDFDLPLEFPFDDVPDVPEAIRSPTPPEKEE